VTQITAPTDPKQAATRATISWLVEDAPAEYADLIATANQLNPREAVFVTYVPDCMRFTHSPRTSIVSEQIDGGVVYVE
jgi:hypothetical protein